jgi:hypothetical protein
MAKGIPSFSIKLVLKSLEDEIRMLYFAFFSEGHRKRGELNAATSPMEGVVQILYFG